MKEGNLSAIRAANTMNTALLTALFIHHPRQKRVLDSFSRLAETVMSSSVASKMSEEQLEQLTQSQEAWMAVLHPLAGTKT